MISRGRAGVELSRFPYPFQSALAISNDVEFMTPRAFWDIHRFLNTTEDTPIGRGLGLPVTDSIFMFSTDPARSFSYFGGTSTEPSRHAGWLRELMAAGVIDVLHALGDFDGLGGCTRRHAAAALEELQRYGIGLEVWTNHGSAENTQNIGGSQATYQRGDLPGADEYHADLTTQYGIRFCWLDFNATNDMPQDARARRFRPEPADPLLRDETLRDGNRVRLFQRYRGPNRPDPATLPEQLSAENLGRLVELEGVTVVYQHFGCDRSTGSCVPNEPPYFDDEQLAALRRVAELRDRGETWVAGVAALLRYRALHETLDWSEREAKDGAVEIAIRGVSDAGELAGITFTARSGRTLRVVGVDEREGVREIAVRRNPERGGRVSVTVPLVDPELPPTPPDRYLEL